MIRLLRLISLLTLVLIIGLVAIVGLTYRNTNRFAYLFTRPDGTRCETPCLFGADPATMMVDQIDKTLSAVPILKHNSDLYIEGSTYSNDHLQVHVTQNTAIHVTVKVVSDFPTLGELLVIVGQPERISLYKLKQSDQVVCRVVSFIMQGKWIIFRLQANTGVCMNPSQKISEIGVSTLAPASQSLFIPWHGFTTDSSYHPLVD